MLSDDELRELIQRGEADHVERTVSVTDTDKFGEAICSFANDLPNRGSVGLLVIGVNDNGTFAQPNVLPTEKLLQSLVAFRTEGNILPPPMLSARQHVLDGNTIVVVEVKPSTNPPVKYKGRVCVRLGPRRGFATAEEERQLIEKRVWGNLPFDQHAIAGSSTTDMDALRFKEEIVPAMVHPDVDLPLPISSS